MDRKSKIQFLTNIMQGKISNKELGPQNLKHEVEIEGPGKKYLNGRQITEQEYQYHLKRQPGYATHNLKIDVTVQNETDEE